MYQLLTALALLSPSVCHKLRHVQRPKNIHLGTWVSQQIQPGHKVSLQTGKVYQTADVQTNKMNE